jgi:purine-binding chemotaxis protein CheW
MTGSMIKLLTFELGGERYAVALESVREVVRAVAVTRLAGAPAVVDGIIEVRGQVVPVFDAGMRLGLGRRELVPSQRFLLVETGRRLVALRVDEVEWVQEVAAAEVAQPRRFVRGGEAIAGVVALGGGLVLIHDVERFLSDAETATLEAALTAVDGAER